MPFTIIRQDITKMKVDAIVNAGNPQLQMGGGVCGAIFHAAGAEALQKACNPLAPISVGQAVITPGFQLPARFIIHTSGPIYSRYTPEESRRLLEAAYENSLMLAAEKGCESIAFPLISGGIYGYPKDEAARTAASVIRKFLSKQDMDVYLTVFDRLSFLAGRELMGQIQSYIDEHYVDCRSPRGRRLLNCENKAEESVAGLYSMRLEDALDKLDEPFHVSLLRMIDEKGMDDAQVYRRANVSRKQFSKIRSGKVKAPKKTTILALAVAMQLTLEQTKKLLERAGLALTHTSRFDVIVEYFIVNGEYDIFTINNVLFSYDQPLLGCNA